VRRSKYNIPRSTTKLHCATPKQLREHLEALMWPGMTWDNWSREPDTRFVWWVDHILPPKLFDLLDPIEQRAWCNKDNLQPLWRGHNIAKRDSTNWTLEGQELLLPDGTISTAPAAAHRAMTVTKDELIAKVHLFDERNRN
jgi:hypothetical protein